MKICNRANGSGKAYDHRRAIRDVQRCRKILIRMQPQPFLNANATRLMWRDLYRLKNHPGKIARRTQRILGQSI